jgi:hypothetical protein
MKSCVALLLILVFTSVRAAEISPEKKQEINHLIKLTGMEKLMNQVVGQMLDSLKTAHPEVPADFWETFRKHADVHEFLDQVIPLYDKYYTLEDLKGINAFYESPAGQKILNTMPQIMQESMKLGQEWGTRIGQKAAAEIEQKRREKEKAPKV